MAEKLRALADSLVTAKGAFIGFRVAWLVNESNFHAVAFESVEIVKALGCWSSPFEHARKIAGDGWNVNLFLLLGRV